jgi:hypothetical protein
MKMKMKAAPLLLCLLTARTTTAFAPSPTTSSFGGRRHLGALRSTSTSTSTSTMMGDAFTVGILGDLHMDPRVLEDYEAGRSHWLPIFRDAKATCGEQNVALVSLGDLGESKSVRPKETTELFAGTTECHELAAEYLSSFDGVPYEVVGGNHGTHMLFFFSFSTVFFFALVSLSLYNLSAYAKHSCIVLLLLLLLLFSTFL